MAHVEVTETPPALGDLNHDGAPDLVKVDLATRTSTVLVGTGTTATGIPTSSSSAGNLYLFRGLGTGAFAPPTTVVAGSFSQPTDVAIGDLNGDLRLDLVVTNTLSQDLSVFLGRGDGSFEPELRFDSRFFPTARASFPTRSWPSPT